MGWVVYVLACADGTLYTGITNDLPARLAVHGTKRGARYTRGRGPFRVAYLEPCESKSEALKRERAIKALPAVRKRALCALPVSSDP